MFPLLVLFLLPFVLAGQATASDVMFPAENDWWVIGAENTLVFKWAHKGGEPVTSLYNVNKTLMDAPFFWESRFYVDKGNNVVNSSNALVGAKPGHGYYITIDVLGKHLTSHTFEIKDQGAALRPVPEVARASSARSSKDLTRGTVITIASITLAAFFFSLGSV